MARYADIDKAIELLRKAAVAIGEEADKGKTGCRIISVHIFAMPKKWKTAKAVILNAQE